MSSYGVPTPLDYMHAAAYAYQQIAAAKCKDPDVIKAVCENKNSPAYPGGGQCISWREDKRDQTFPIPSSYYVKRCNTNDDCLMGFCGDNGVCTCYKDTDCGQGMGCIQDPNSQANLICGFAPKDTTAGHCIFNNKTACEAQGQLPYTCNKDGCTSRSDDEQQKYPYTEWNVGDDGKGKCILGNFVLRQWCENPSVRCAPDKNGNKPAECGDGGYNVSNVPPFYYDSSKSACYMTHDYCTQFGLSYNKGSCDPKNPDPNACPGPNNTCMYDQNSDGYITGAHCTGPDADCTESSGQKFGEFLVGRTLFYMFSKGDFPWEKCKEKYTHNQERLNVLNKNIAEKLKTTPEIICTLADDDKVQKKMILAKNYARDGIHLYAIKWGKSEAGIGYLASEVKKFYPQIVEKTPKGICICMTKEEIGTDNGLKRIYLTLASKGWIENMLGNVLRR
jgi:hypothetical protein